MGQQLSELVRHFIQKMEGVYEEKVDLSSKDLNLSLAEARLFNELRHNVLTLEKVQLQEVVDGIPEDQFPMEEAGLVLQRRTKKSKNKSGH